MPDTLTHITTSGVFSEDVREAGIALTWAHLRQGAAFMAEEIARGGGVFVHCGSGVGRAPTMAAAYLVGAGKTVDEAWEMIREKRPFVRPNPGQVAQVERFAAEIQD